MRARAIRVVEITVVTTLALAVSAVVRTVCHSVFNETIPYTPFYPAIVISTMYGRLPGGILAVILATFAASFWLFPFGQPLIKEPTDLIGLVLFIAVSGLVVGLVEAMLRSQQTTASALEVQRLALSREHAARIEAEEASRLKEQFLASASHELRTPLQAILGWTQLLAKRESDAKSLATGLEVIERNARVQARLIDDMLDISRMLAGKMRLSPRFFDPQAIMESAIQTVANAAHAKQISIVQRCENDGRKMWADPDRLQQIMWNLLSNSIKFSPPWSSVQVSLRATPQNWEIEVADEGQGVDANFLPHLFERFRQEDTAISRKHDGLGLGLAIVKQLVELHGGTIKATSAGVGKGLSVVITLPVVDQISFSPSACVTRTASDERSDRIHELNGVRVLVVEDDPSTCELIARTLREHDCKVAAVTSVERALVALRNFDPDVIVSDIAMPGQNGYELLKQVRVQENVLRPIPALALTALSSDQDRRNAFEAGYRMHLAKPVDSSTLTEAVAELAYS